MIAYSSAGIKRVVNSTFSGELLQQCVAFDEARWLVLLRQEMTGRDTDLHMKSDHLGLIQSLNSLRQQVKEKRLMGNLWSLREAFENHEITTYEHIPTRHMLADGMTKANPELRQPIVQAMKGTMENYVIEEGKQAGLTVHRTRSKEAKRDSD